MTHKWVGTAGNVGLQCRSLSEFQFPVACKQLESTASHGFAVRQPRNSRGVDDPQPQGGPCLTLWCKCASPRHVRVQLRGIGRPWSLARRARPTRRASSAWCSSSRSLLTQPPRDLCRVCEKILGPHGGGNTLWGVPCCGIKDSWSSGKRGCQKSKPGVKTDSTLSQGSLGKVDCDSAKKYSVHGVLC